MIDEIKSLPPLPSTIVRIQQMCMNSDTEISDLVKVIESDPMLSANILKAVNSPLYGMSREISAIPQAIMLFGVSMIRGFAAANAIKKSIAVDLTPYNIGIDELSHISTLQGALVCEWYRHIDKSMLPLLQSSAFLMELGKLITSLKIITSGESDTFASEIAQGKSIVDVERCYLGLTSYEAAAMMFEHWNFESALTEALWEAVHPETLNPYAQVLYVLNRAINIRSVLTEESLSSAYESIESFGLNRSAFDEAVLYLQSKQQGKA